MQIEPIAHIMNGFQEKFGIPRQSGLTDAWSQIVFEPKYRVPQAFRGLEEYSHIWLIWDFSKAHREQWSPTVRPPRLGGNVRKGVFATRSPFRPNSLGLSCVKLEKLDMDTPQGPVLYVYGADMLDGTPIYDIKPYLPYADSIPHAEGGFAEAKKSYHLRVEFPGQWKSEVTAEEEQILIQLLSQDPRPSYQEEPERIYGMSYGGMNVKFTVADGVLTVRGIQREQEEIEELAAINRS